MTVTNVAEAESEVVQLIRQAWKRVSNPKPPPLKSEEKSRRVPVQNGRAARSNG